MDVALMVIAIIFLFISLFVLLLSIFMWIKATNSKTNFFINQKEINKYKNILKCSSDIKEDAEAGWRLGSNSAIPISANSRKASYSDKKESNRFCENIKIDRIKQMDELDKKLWTILN